MKLNQVNTDHIVIFNLNGKENILKNITSTVFIYLYKNNISTMVYLSTGRYDHHAITSLIHSRKIFRHQKPSMGFFGQYIFSINKYIYINVYTYKFENIHLN